MQRGRGRGEGLASHADVLRGLSRDSASGGGGGGGGGGGKLSLESVRSAIPLEPVACKLRHLLCRALLLRGSLPHRPSLSFATRSFILT